LYNLNTVLAMGTLRIRDNGEVRELNIPKDKLEELQKVVDSNIMEKTKHLTIRKMTDGSPCCVCDGIPAVEVIYSVPDGGATRLERYCSRCIERVYSREEVL
jgi:hypothetical protein